MKRFIYASLTIASLTIGLMVAVTPAFALNERFEEARQETMNK